jgi:4-hydroxy-tetrahydrodipicolinate synthase
VPVIAYNVPARTAVDMLPATVVRLAQLPRMAGIKEAVPQIERIRELMAGCPDRFSILSGDDATASESVLAGAHGVISVTANVVPQAMAELMSVSRRDDRASAQRLDGTLAALHAALFAEPNPIPVKWALKRLGRIGGGIRLPLTPLSESYWPAVESALTEAGALRT